MKFSWSFFNLESQNQKGMHPNSRKFMPAPVSSTTFPPQFPSYVWSRGYFETKSHRRWIILW